MTHPSRKTLAIGAIVVAAGLVAATCRKVSPLTPGVLEGTWTGRVTDRGWGGGTASIRFRALPIGVGGAWTFRFDAVPVQAGSLNGTLSGTSVTLVLSADDLLPCGLATSLAVAGTREGDRITGTYARFACEGSVGGTIDLTRAD